MGGVLVGWAEVGVGVEPEAVEAEGAQSSYTSPNTPET